MDESQQGRGVGRALVQDALAPRSGRRRLDRRTRVVGPRAFRRSQRVLRTHRIRPLSAQSNAAKGGGGRPPGHSLMAHRGDPANNEHPAGRLSGTLESAQPFTRGHYWSTSIRWSAITGTNDQPDRNPQLVMNAIKLWRAVEATRRMRLAVWRPCVITTSSQAITQRHAS